MKLLFIANSRIPTERAMGTAIMKQCEAFAKAGITVELLVPIRSNSLREDPYVYHNIVTRFPIHHLQSFDIPFLEKLRLRFYVQKISFFISLCLYVWRSDADFLYTREPEIIGLVPTSIRKVVELHHLYGFTFLPKTFLHRCACIITITKALKEDVIAKFGVRESLVSVMANGVDLEALVVTSTKAEVRKALDIPSEKPVVMYIGSFEDWKGYKTLLEASQHLKEKYHFAFIGGKDDQVVELRKAYPYVQFLGTLPSRELPNYQQAADVLVIPNSAKELISARHTSPLKVFTHMASGVPIVASRITSISEVLNDTNAILVSPDDIESLCEGIMFALEHADVAHARALRAKQDSTQYDWNTRARTIISYLNESTSKTNR